MPLAPEPTQAARHLPMSPGRAHSGGLVCVPEPGANDAGVERAARLGRSRPKSRDFRLSIATASAVLVVLMAASAVLPSVGSGLAGAPPPTVVSNLSSTSAASSPASEAASSRAASGPAGGSPHPGTLDVYEVAPGGATTLDPAQASDTFSEEPILNTYETLVQYDGNSTSTFVPALATCVPGSSQCASEYGYSLINDSNTGQPEYWTFVLDSAARFYDPNTGTGWPVYPSDVMFSLARAMAFSEVPAVGVSDGWVQAQALLPPGNPAWDNGLHFPYNTTPENILGSMFVNDSTYCPATAMSAANGCITFNATGSGTAWPFFLQLMATVLGAGIVPCGWFTSEGAGVPGFYGSSNANGDGPCLLPGNATSTSDASYRTWLAGQSPTSWDAYEELGYNWPAAQPNVQWNAVGSGPYYLASVSTAVGYELQSNPDYAQPTGCAGQVGCMPAPNAYEPTVMVYWEPDDTAGLQEYIAGQADLAEIETTNTAQLLELVAQGKAYYTSFPTLSTFFMPFTLDFSAANESLVDPTTGQINIPEDFFSADTVRELLANSWPYATIQNTISTVDGVEYGLNYGGAIPQGLGNYYPSNISWPSGDPVTNSSIPGSAGWWWAQGTDPASPYYDAQLAGCTRSSPCRFPVIGIVGMPPLDAMIALFDNEIVSVTGGALQPYTFDLSFTELAAQFGYPAGSSPCPLYNFGFAPNYPDPSDYAGALYAPEGTFPAPDAVSSQLGLTAYNSSSCQPADTGYGSWSSLTYWANMGPIPNDCQGAAYDTASAWMAVAATLPYASTQRVLEYNLIEHIMNELALYIYWQQIVGVASAASWISQASINTNPMIGGAGDMLWYNIRYSVPPQTLTFTESGLPAGTSWSVMLTAGSQSATSTGTSIAFSLAPGAYSYQIGMVAGYAASPASGSALLANASGRVTISFSARPGPVFPVQVVEGGLVWGTPYTVVINDYGSVREINGLANFELPNGSYTYFVLYIGPYAQSSNVTGTLVIDGAQPYLINLFFTGTFGVCGCEPTYPVTIQLNGTPAGTAWTGYLSGYDGLTYANSTTAGSAAFWEQNGTTSYLVSAGLAYQSASGTVTVNGTAVTQTVSVLPLPSVAVTFLETGLPQGTTWSVSLNGVNSSSSASSITFTAPNGTYQFSPYARGYVATPSNGLFVIVGRPSSQSVAFSPASLPSAGSPSWTYLGPLAYVIIGALAVVAAAAVAVLRGGRSTAPPARPRREPGDASPGEGPRDEAAGPSTRSDPVPRT
jgi:hypothetical protein